MNNNNERVVASNRKARHNYHIIDKLEAGIALKGTEVKSVRDGSIDLRDSYAEIKKGEVFLINMHISPYKQANLFNHNPLRERKLLVHKKEIRKLFGKVQEKGMTLIPLKVYIRNGKVKVELALAKGKISYDKRETIIKRDLEREQGRDWKAKI